MTQQYNLADNKAALDALDNVAHYVGFTSWNVTEEKNKDVFRALKTIRAALQGAAMSQKVDEWQHISTAPKDGSDTIIYCETSGEMFIAFYAEQITTGQKDWVIARANDGTCFILKDPTHWMPLPPQPKGGDDD